MRFDKISDGTRHNKDFLLRHVLVAGIILKTVGDEVHLHLTGHKNQVSRKGIAVNIAFKRRGRASNILRVSITNGNRKFSIFIKKGRFEKRTVSGRLESDINVSLLIKRGDINPALVDRID